MYRPVNPRDLAPGHRLEGVGEAPVIARVDPPTQHPDFGEVVVVTFTAPDVYGQTRRELPTASDVSAEPGDSPPPSPAPSPLPAKAATTPAADRKATR